MGLTEIQKEMIRGIATNNILKARQGALGALNEDTTQKNKNFVARYKSILTSEHGFLYELPAELKGLLQCEDVSMSFKESRYYVSEQQMELASKIFRMAEVSQKLMELQIPYKNATLLYGPPGTGKTTLAKVIANTTSADFTQINATVAGKKDMEEVVKQEKMLDVFKEHLRWNYIMGLSNVGDFNLACEEGHATDLINVAEALQEKKIAQIADEIYHRGENGNRVKLVLISGPSSSGKTTFSKRLSVQLMTNGLRPYPISLDNYFVDREDTPRDENGDYDYESLYALDLELFNNQLQALLRGEEVELPRFNFTLGKKEYKGDKLRIDEHTILILEGIHALNPELTPQIPAESKYKIYVSALTTISLDDHNWIPTTDNRLLRRIIRDFNYRGYSAQETISRWPSVRAGEDKWIFPYQENADVMFNSALLFEFAVLRCHAEPILTGVPRNCPEYAEAYRLMKFIKYFTPVQDKEIPPTSLLREFLGGSSFKY